MAVATDQFQFVRQLVQTRTAIVLGEDKKYLVDSRLAPLARDLGFGDADAVVQHLRRVPNLALEQRILEALTTNETLWFRDRQPFEALASHVLPQLVQRNAATRQLRIWSAACSSGQEIYSLAMLLDEQFPELRNHWHVDLFGTDFCTEMVTRATEGLYSTLEVNRGLPASLLVRYFDREGANWRLKPHVRSRARFGTMNLAGPWPPMSAFDLVLMRNVLIYFDVPTKERLLKAAGNQLAPGGYVLLGAAETAVGLCTDLTPVRLGDAVFYSAKGPRS
ncbi:MAG TPA: protein-glutamate O-methyltransferase CheR [Acidimicrobiales bacterium]|nr:protein-glutamate O-methyltransferase CheR [Acidimicrobiales bacterium]